MTNPQEHAAYQQVEFPSKDGLMITADFYRAEPQKGSLVLCHRSHCNRAEYRETAPRFVALGFTCLAIDQRSGMKIFGETNETSKRARAAGLATGYLDARIDIESAVDFAYKRNSGKPILLLGSSYSASLALLCAMNNEKIAAVLAFSPGEFLKNVSVQESIRALKKPIFVTSSKVETADATDVVRLVDKTFVTQHLPTIDGFHGSKMLWKAIPGSDEYWTAAERFLGRLGTSH